MPTSISLSLLLPQMVSLHLYECTNTVKQRMIPGGNNDKSLTVVDRPKKFVTRPFLTKRRGMRQLYMLVLL